MPSRNGTLAPALAALFYAACYATCIWALCTFVAQETPWWLTALTFLPPILSLMLHSRSQKRRFQERGEFACRVREVPGGGAGLSGRWRSAVVIPSYQRLSITGHAADRPPVSHITWDEPIDEGLVQLRNVIELSRREPTLAETLRLGPSARIARCRADGAVVEIAAPEQYLHHALRVLKEFPQAR